MVYQMNVKDPASNIDNITNKLRSIGLNEEQTLLVLPELFLTGYDEHSIHKVGNNFFSSVYFKTLLSLADKYNLMIYGSVPEKDGDNYYNTGILIDKNGLINKYRKSHLFRPMEEDKLFKAGREVIVSKNLGLSICYDLRFPELYQKQSELGARILLVVAEWPSVRIDHWLSLLKARAIETQSFIVGVNRVGTDLYKFGGHSVIYDPYGEKELFFDHDYEEIALIDINLDKIDLFRGSFNTKDDKWLH